MSQVLDWKSLRPIFQLDPAQAAKRWSSLTPRESEVAEMMAHGWTNQQIAESLKISPKTLDIHRSKVKSKLEAKTSAGVSLVFFVVQLSKVLSTQE